MKIPLTQGKYALVEAQFHAQLIAMGPWYASKTRKTFYAKNDRRGYLHRVVWKLVHPGNVPRRLDHINQNGLDCRIRNLRPATNGENLRNHGRNSNNKSGYKGVS